MFMMGIIATIIVVVINYKNISIKNGEVPNGNINYDVRIHKYDKNKVVSELGLNTIDDYVSYLDDMKNQVEIVAIRKMIKIDKIRAKRYKNANRTQKRTGYEIIDGLISGAYQDLINIVIQKNQTWEDLPLTKHFRSKFNEKDGCIKEIDFRGKTTHHYSCNNNNKSFSIEYTYIPDDAYEKYPKEVIDYMLEYNGAYNMDYYNYKFVLDEEGYLDDIIFIGITPHMVEGRFVDEGE